MYEYICIKIVIFSGLSPVSVTKWASVGSAGPGSDPDRSTVLCHCHGTVVFDPLRMSCRIRTPHATVAHQLSDTITRTPPYLADNAVWQVYSLRSGFTGYQ